MCADPDCVCYDDHATCEAEAAELRRQIDLLRSALKCLVVGACAVACPNQGEREVLQDAVDIARTAIAEAKGSVTK